MIIKNTKDLAWVHWEFAIIWSPIKAIRKTNMKIQKVNWEWGKDGII